jgi:hypothetical protein
MKSTNFLNALILVLVLLVFPLLYTGCGTSPEQVVANFIERVKADDTEGAKKLATMEFGKKLTTAKAFFDLIGFNPADVGTDSFKVDNLSSEINGDTAKVTRKDKGFFSFVLKKESGQWKIDNIESNLKLPAIGDKIREKFEQRRENK